jgi:uncharacterized protein with HEPN domain
MKKDSIVYLKHIMDAVRRIEKYLDDVTCEEFLENELVQAAVIREIEIVGEAAKRLPVDFRNKHPDMPWRKMAGMRDKLVHDYMGVDIDAVWDTVDRDIPQLKKKLSAIIAVEERN